MEFFFCVWLIDCICTNVKELRFVQPGIRKLSNSLVSLHQYGIKHNHISSGLALNISTYAELSDAVRPARDGAGRLGQVHLLRCTCSTCPGYTSHLGWLTFGFLTTLYFDSVILTVNCLTL